MFFQKSVNYAGFLVEIQRETRTDPYVVCLDTNVNHLPYLPQALEGCKWEINLESFNQGKPVWITEVVGPSTSGLINQTYQKLEALYNTRRLIELEEERAKRIAMFGRDPEEGSLGD